MVDVNGVLMGFVVGFASGLFTAFKLAQRAKVNQPPVQPSARRPPISNADLLDEGGQSIFLPNNHGGRK